MGEGRASIRIPPVDKRTSKPIEKFHESLFEPNFEDTPRSRISRARGKAPENGSAQFL